jgi:hypothetical protein
MAHALLTSSLHKFTNPVTEEVRSKTNIMENDTYTVDGMKVTKQCYWFCTELRSNRSFNGCKFGVMDGQEYGHKNGMWVYFPDEIYCRGFVGHMDVGVMATLYKYFVEAEGISNNKVKSDRRQHNILSSTTIDKAIKIAKQHLRKHDIPKIVGLTAYKLTSALSREKTCKSEAEDEAMGLLQSMLSRNGALTAELVNMVKTNYEFNDDHVKEGITAYMNTINDDIEVSSRNVRIILVLVHPPHTDGAEHEITVQRGEQHLNLAKRVYVTDVMASLKDAQVETYTPATLPEDIAHKISTLNILEGHDYVDGVGCQQSENIYYIAEDA